MIVTYEDILRLRNSPLMFDVATNSSYSHMGGRSIKFKKHDFPWSVTETEFIFLYNTILRYDLKRGLDLCTGTGMSALAAGLAMRETNGKVVTIDAYIEEYYNHFKYGEKIVLQDSDGWKNINYLIQHFNIDANLKAEVGWSPTDVPSIIEKHFSNPLDYVFIDGGHEENQLIDDITAILPYTNKGTLWLLHDCNEHAGVWTQKTQAFFREKLSSRVVIQCPIELGNHNLAMLVKS